MTDTYYNPALVDRYVSFELEHLQHKLVEDTPNESTMATAGRLAGEAAARQQDAALAKYLAYAQGLMGERRTLTPAEELNLAKADKLRKKANKLKRRAHKLRKRAERLEPQNLYPDSPLSKLVDPSPLPARAGTTLIIPPPYRDLTSRLFPQPEPNEEDGA